MSIPLKPVNNTLGRQLTDSGSFDFYFREWYPALCLFSLRITGDQRAAEDYAEEAFIKLWENRHQFEQAGSIRAYLYTVVRNASISYLRHLKTKKVYAATQQQQTLPEELPAWEALVEAETLREVYQCLNHLPPRCKKVLELLFVEGKNYQQIAREMDLTIDTVRAQKARGVRLIKRRLRLPN